MGDNRFSAIILAAGFSSRMKGLKPLLRIGEKSFVEHAVELFRTTNSREIVTVLGHQAQKVLPVVRAAGSRYVINESFTEGMYSSVQTGVKALEHPCDAFFLLPVDIPLVKPSTVWHLADAFDRHCAPPVCYPLFRSKRGHPPLIHARLADSILSYEGQGGMREFLKRYEEQAALVNVEDPFIYMDADTKEELDVLRKEYSRFVSPSEQLRSK